MDTDCPWSTINTSPYPRILKFPIFASIEWILFAIIALATRVFLSDISKDSRAVAYPSPTALQFVWNTYQWRKGARASASAMQCAFHVRGYAFCVILPPPPESPTSSSIPTAPSVPRPRPRVMKNRAWFGHPLRQLPCPCRP